MRRMLLIAGVFALGRRLLPGTVGLTEPLGFADKLVRETRPAEVERVLCASFAQGGANAAFVLTR